MFLWLSSTAASKTIGSTARAAVSDSAQLFCLLQSTSSFHEGSIWSADCEVLQ